MKGLILSGGRGTRLRPLTHTGPKQLIPIANKPNILYCLEDLRDAGIKDIGVILGDMMPEKVRELLGDGSAWGVRLTYIVQGEPRGIAHAVGCARDFMGESPFVVYLGDNVLKGGIKAMAEKFEREGCDALIALTRVPDPQRFGVAELDGRGNIVRLVEKPKEPKSDLALVGIYFFRSRIFDMIRELRPSWRNELEITEAIDMLVKRGYRVAAHIVTGWWKDTGKPEDILEVNHLVLDDLQPYNRGVVERDVVIKGRVGIGEGTRILSGTVIRGPAIIGRGCTIGPSTYIGPYTSIGDGTVVEGGEIEGSIVVGDCRISCGRKLVDSLIGRGCSILSSDRERPEGVRVVIGENSVLKL
ncbi:MAG: glucose-1-phosphate thymidylyltransferase [Thermoplasmatota archaeon]